MSMGTLNPAHSLTHSLLLLLLLLIVFARAVCQDSRLHPQVIKILLELLLGSG